MTLPVLLALFVIGALKVNAGGELSAVYAMYYGLTYAVYQEACCLSVASCVRLWPHDRPLSLTLPLV